MLNAEMRSASISSTTTIQPLPPSSKLFISLHWASMAALMSSGSVSKTSALSSTSASGYAISLYFRSSSSISHTAVMGVE